MTHGSRIGPYEIVGAIGAGGMGEVLRGHDTKLGRDVAIKVLPAAFAQDAERVARFRREAQILASLNHPNIAGIHGLEESEGVLALVMELVEGEDLAARLKRGAIPVDECVAIARQIAKALEEAHEKGIVHRDLKPANVKVTADGKVKVLDFGLAKAFGGADPISASGSPDLSQSPTLATAAGTQAGVILGTAAYMSPEQARGKAVDRRADIWSFGVVLFEMLSGTRLFGGETVSDTLAAVLTREPDWATLPETTPARIVRLLQRCLTREPRQRLQAIAEARIALETADEPAAAGGSAPRGRSLVPIGAALLASALVAAVWLLRPPATEGPVRKLDLTVLDLETGLGRTPALSPDGSRVAWIERERLWVRRLDQLDPVEMTDSGDAYYFAWSPDSRHLAYVRKGRAWRVSVDGGPATDLGPVPTDLEGSGGGAWGADGQIVFAGSNEVGLWAIPEGGGAGRDLLPLDHKVEADFHEISALPDGRGLLFTVHLRGRMSDAVQVLAGGTRRTVLELPGESVRQPVYSPTGHILYERETTNPGLWAVPFSLERLETTGVPFLVQAGASAPSVARDGTLCFARPDMSPIELVRASRTGVVESVTELAGTSSAALTRSPVAGASLLLAGLSLSPDGQRVALSLGLAPGQVLVHDLARGTQTRVSSRTFPRAPVWMPSGDRLMYTSSQGARAWNVRVRRADAGGEERILAASDETQIALAVSPDGATLLYWQGGNTSGSLLALPTDGSRPAQPIVKEEAGRLGASFSPDGRFIAYGARESGRTEVYVRSSSTSDERVQVSTNGGESPVWKRNDEILFLSGDVVNAVSVARRGSSIVVSKPVELFRTGGASRLAPAFDVTPDGQHFYLLRSRGHSRLSVILGWPRDLARLQSEALPGTTR